MIHKPYVGMKVCIINIVKASSYIGGELTCDFDVARGDTGTIIEIENTKPRGHSPKFYSIQLDPPNVGTYVTLGTEHIEDISERSNERSIS